MTLTQGPIATTFDERIANLITAYKDDTSNEASTIRWLVANLQRARSALAALVAGPSTSAADYRIAQRGLEEIPEVIP